MELLSAMMKKLRKPETLRGTKGGKEENRGKKKKGEKWRK